MNRIARIAGIVLAAAGAAATAGARRTASTAPAPAGEPGQTATRR